VLMCSFAARVQVPLVSVLIAAQSCTHTTPEICCGVGEGVVPPVVEGGHCDAHIPHILNVGRKGTPRV